MEKCKNCKYFDNRLSQNISPLIPKSEKFGLCKHAGSDETNEYKHLYMPHPGVSIIVGENFGCTNFDSKTALA